ncbi:MAG: TA system VapC family ribonuclease toxin [Verrucomicrobiota bacterium]|nr:TA system VapC family ribonuclease toxin [Verrucomicrobiota bacterium]
MLTTDTNLLIHAADPDSPHHEPARNFFLEAGQGREEFVLCELVLVELYMQLRNPAIFAKPYTAKEATSHCLALKQNPVWRCIDYDPMISQKLWSWATETKAGFRQIIDARIAFTLRHHRVTRFATANVKHFQGFGFQEVWNPLTI